jgi:hypothetical protein
LDEAQQLNET